MARCREFGVDVVTTSWDLTDQPRRREFLDRGRHFDVRRERDDVLEIPTLRAEHPSYPLFQRTTIQGSVLRDNPFHALAQTRSRT